MRRANHHKARLVVVLNARHSSLNGRVITTLQQLSLFSLLPPTRVARCEYIWLSFSCRCSPCLTINQRRSKEKLIIAFHVCNCHPCSGPLLSGHQCHHQPCRRQQNKGIIHPPSLSPPFYSTSFCSNSWFLCSRDIILGGQAAAANPHLATRDTLIQS